jgi:2-methylisocitrate lyase-like PEP mutase family enzyme
MRTQMEKAVLFRALHERPGAFVIPNPWDAGTAKLLTSLGFEALATTSLGLANTLGSATIRTVVSALGKPFNLVMGFADPTLTVDQLSAAGVKRISVGGAMSRFALAAFLKCAREMKDMGSFTYVRETAPIKDLRDAFAAVEG